MKFNFYYKKCHLKPIFRWHLSLQAVKFPQKLTNIQLHFKYYPQPFHHILITVIEDDFITIECGNLG